MKDLKISEELLSEVLKLEVVKHSLYNKSNSSFNITYMESEDSLKSSWMPINIYEFAFKCKEWAFSKGYTILTEFVNQNGVFSYVVSNKQSIENYGYLENVKVLNYIPHNKSEVEAIIKACEWILEYKENQCTK